MKISDPIHPAQAKRMRRFERFDMDKRLKIHAAGEVLRGRCTNISEGGLGATIAGQIKVGEEVNMELALDATADHVKVKAVVRNTFGFHYGFEFVDLSGEARRAIIRVVAANEPPPEQPKPENPVF